MVASTTPTATPSVAVAAEAAHDHASHDHSAPAVTATAIPTTVEVHADGTVHDHAAPAVVASTPTVVTPAAAPIVMTSTPASNPSAILGLTEEAPALSAASKSATAPTPSVAPVAAAPTVTTETHVHADGATHEHTQTVSTPTPATTAHAHNATATIGQPGAADKVDRVVTITMTDNMRYEPSAISVKANETVRFVVENKGLVKHEMTLGTPDALAQHAEQMMKFPNMQHTDPNMIALEPGKSGEIIWQFTQTGRVDFACLQPGHFAAGMRGEVDVSANGS